MKRLIPTVLAAIVFTMGLALPAQARQPRTVHWQCEVPDEGTVVFLTAAGAARHGINTANRHAGQTFFDRFGEACTVV